MGLPQVTIFGEHVSIATNSETEPCAGTLPYMDRFVREFSQILYPGAAAPTGLTFYWLPGPVDEAPCVGCAPGTEVYSPSIPFDHELGHTTAFFHIGQTETFFNEGLAEAAALEPLDLYAPVPTLEHMVGTDREVPVGYADAGRLVGHLLRHHDPAVFRAFAEQLGSRSTSAETLSAFQDAYAATLDEMAEQSVAGASQCYLDVGMCSAPRLDPVGDVWTLDEPMDCANENVIGPTFFLPEVAWTRGGDSSDADAILEASTNWRVLTVEIPTAGSYRLEVGAARAVLEACRDCAPDSPTKVDPGSSLELDLDPAIYAIRLSVPATTAPPPGLRLARLTP